MALMLAGHRARDRPDPCENPGVSSYYDIDAANARLAELKPILAALRDARDEIAAGQLRLAQLESAEDADQALLAREQEGMTVTVRQMEQAVRQIDAWGVTLRDIGTGLVDFPALVNGRPIWLCWKLGEDDIAYWHELDAGIAGRKPLIELE
jgi:hypothetical protein